VPYPCSLNVPSLQDAGPMGDQNPMAYVHKGGVRIKKKFSVNNWLANHCVSQSNKNENKKSIIYSIQEPTAP
jgi:hypothetical protein